MKRTNIGYTAGLACGIIRVSGLGCHGFQPPEKREDSAGPGNECAAAPTKRRRLGSGMVVIPARCAIEGRSRGLS
jgi:hypothetical protein